MSFFYDFLDYFDLKDLTNEVVVSFVLDKGITVVGNFKIDVLEENLVVLKIKKEKLFISGEKLKIKSLALGEIVVFGKIYKISVGEK